LSAEVNAGLNSKKRAIQELNPKMSEGVIDDLVAQIDKELPSIQIPEFKEKKNGKA
jgi:hypothetical protein